MKKLSPFSISTILRFVSAGSVALYVVLPYLSFATPTLPSPVLLPPPNSGGRYLPKSTLRLVLEADMREVKLAASLDNIDITPFVTVADGLISIHPPELLKNGDHRLELYATGSGQSSKLGQWSFTVAGSVNTDFQISSTLNLSGRVANNTGSDSADYQMDGSVDLSGTLQYEDWSVEGRGDLLLQTNKSIVETGSDGSSHNTFDLGEYLITVRKGNISTKLGHHQSSPQSLVMSGFSRRGVSLAWASKSEIISGQGFSYSSRPVTGFDNFLGISNSAERVIGGVAAIQPFSFGDTEISGTWLTGKTTPNSSVSGTTNDTVSGGEAWSLALSSRPFSDSLLFRGEYAQTDYRLDEERDVSQTDSAWVASLVWNLLQPFLGSDGSASWQVGVEQRHVGPGFRSVARQGLPQDVDSTRLFSTLLAGTVSLRGELERQLNNTDDSPLLPTIATDLVSLSFDWTASQEGHDTPWYGIPGVSMLYTRSSQGVEKNTPGSPISLDLTGEQIGGTVAFRYDSWDWQTGYTLIEQDDRTNTQPDTRNQMVSLGINGHLGDAYYGSSFLQFNENTDLETDTSIREILLNLNATALLFSDRLTATMNLTQSFVDDDVAQSRTSTLDCGLTWAVRQPRSGAVGMSVWLKGQFQVHDDEASEGGGNTENSQVFAGVTLNYGQ